MAKTDCRHAELTDYNFLLVPGRLFNPVFYKNFQLILEYEPEQRFTFPSRRIKGVRTNSVV